MKTCSACNGEGMMGRKMVHAAPDKMKMTMDEYRAGTLHSGSKSGPKVKSRKQAIAIGLSQQRRYGR